MNRILLVLSVFLIFSCEKEDEKAKFNSIKSNVSNPIPNTKISSENSNFSVSLLEDLNRSNSFKAFNMIEQSGSISKYEYQGLNFSSSNGVVFEIKTTSGYLLDKKIKIGDSEKEIVNLLGSPSMRSHNIIQYELSDDGFVLEIKMDDNKAIQFYEGPMN